MLQIFREFFLKKVYFWGFWGDFRGFSGAEKGFFLVLLGALAWLHFLDFLDFLAPLALLALLALLVIFALLVAPGVLAAPALLVELVVLVELKELILKLLPQQTLKSLDFILLCIKCFEGSLLKVFILGLQLLVLCFDFLYFPNEAGIFVFKLAKTGVSAFAITRTSTGHALLDASIFDEILFKVSKETHHHAINHMAKGNAIVTHHLIIPPIKEGLIVKEVIVNSAKLKHTLITFLPLLIKTEMTRFDIVHKIFP